MTQQQPEPVTGAEEGRIWHRLTADSRLSDGDEGSSPRLRLSGPVEVEWVCELLGRKGGSMIFCRWPDGRAFGDEADAEAFAETFIRASHWRTGCRLKTPVLWGPLRGGRLRA